MRAIEELKRRLSERKVPFVAEGSTLTVKASTPTGFDVSLSETAEEATVFFEGWHDHFSNPEEAVRCFLFGLSARCRIRVSVRGGKAHKWVAEAKENEQAHLFPVLAPGFHQVPPK